MTEMKLNLLQVSLDLGFGVLDLIEANTAKNLVMNYCNNLQSLNLLKFHPFPCQNKTENLLNLESIQFVLIQQYIWAKMTDSVVENSTSPR